MMKTSKSVKITQRCAYVKACYLAEGLNCYGYKTDCPLYQESNNEYFDEQRFHDAMDKLIDKTRSKFASKSS